MPQPDCFLRYCISAARRNFTSGKSHVCVLERPDAAATRGFKMVLFTHRSKYHCRCKCAPPCALLGLFIVHCSHLSELCEAQYSVLLQWIESLQSTFFANFVAVLSCQLEADDPLLVAYYWCRRCSRLWTWRSWCCEDWIAPLHEIAAVYWSGFSGRPSNSH